MCWHAVPAAPWGPLKLRDMLRGAEDTGARKWGSPYLTREAFGTRALAASDEVRAKHLKLMEQVFPTGEAGVGFAAGQFLNAMTDLAARPADGATRQVVLARAGDVASRFKAGGQQLDVLQGGVTEELKANVSHLNELSKNVADLNAAVREAGYCIQTTVLEADDFYVPVDPHLG